MGDIKVCLELDSYQANKLIEAIENYKDDGDFCAGAGIRRTERSDELISLSSIVSDAVEVGMNDYYERDSPDLPGDEDLPGFEGTSSGLQGLSI